MRSIISEAFLESEYIQHPLQSSTLIRPAYVPLMPAGNSHFNCTEYIQTHPDFKIARGWIVSTEEQDRYAYCIYFSILEKNGKYIDITKRNPTPPDERWHVCFYGDENRIGRLLKPDLVIDTEGFSIMCRVTLDGDIEFPFQGIKIKIVPNKDSDPRTAEIFASILPRVKAKDILKQCLAQAV
jgi:hypothetical protein